jgi:hypothetical protein
MQTPNATELALRDIHLPESIDWWPPAIGWWMLLIVLPPLFFFIYWLLKRLTRQTALKSGKKHLLALKQNQDLNNFEKLKEISVLLRRISISHFSRTRAARLTGQPWLKFLDQTMPDKPFSEGIGQLLLTGPYQINPANNLDIEALISLCETWLESLSRGKQ